MNTVFLIISCIPVITAVYQQNVNVFKFQDNNHSYLLLNGRQIQNPLYFSNSIKTKDLCTIFA